MSAVDVREVRSVMLNAADGLRVAAAETSQTRLSLPMTYAEGVLRTLAATILPPDPAPADTGEQRAGGKARAASAGRDAAGRFTPREAP